MYSDADAAALYDRRNPWGPSDDFYLSYVRDAQSVLDIGCGTGMLLDRARQEGHAGRLCGIDPDTAALARARNRRPDVEWLEGKAEDLAAEHKFEIAVMASNAFQFFVTDDELRASLARIRAALVDGGRFVFGTRNPAIKEWETWDYFDVVDHAGRELRISYAIESVEADVVRFTETTSTPAGEPLRTDHGSLRFLGVEAVETVLRNAGFEVESVYGDWSRGSLESTSDNIIVVAQARRTAGSA